MKTAFRQPQPEFDPMPLPPVEQPDLGPNMTAMNGESHAAFVEDLNPHVVAANLGPADTETLLAARRVTHGRFQQNAQYGQKLRNLFRSSDGWLLATDREREALDYIAGKLSRILSGSPGYADHWNDIAGYATLAANPDMQRQSSGPFQAYGPQSMAEALARYPDARS